MADEQVTTAQQGFVDPYQYVETPGKMSKSGWDSFADFFQAGGISKDIDANKALYNQMVDREQVNSARAFETWFDSTAVQRRVKDIEKAGLNPWLALQSGGIQSNGSSSVGNSAKSTTFSKDDTRGSFGDVLTTALRVVAMICMLG